MSTPSAAMLNRAFPGHGHAVRMLLTGAAQPEHWPAVAAWVSRCYHRPSAEELIMEAVNAEVGGYGVEAIRGRHVNHYHQDIQAVYVNLGDTYTLTLLLDHETGRYHVVSWGDWVERNERKRGLR